MIPLLAHDGLVFDYESHFSMKFKPVHTIWQLNHGSIKRSLHTRYFKSQGNIHFRNIILTHLLDYFRAVEFTDMIGWRLFISTYLHDKLK